MSFWSELKRRNVVKVAIAYLIVAWLILQVVSIIFPMLNLPSWAGTFVTVLLIIGFPLVLIFAWAFEITPGGLKRTHEVPHDESITHLTGQKLNYIVTGLLVVAVAYILFDNYFLDRRFIETEVASRIAELAPPAVDEEEAPLAPTTVGEEEALKTIAVLPFADLSPERDQEYFVDGLIEELLNSLAKIPDLLVTARTSSFIFKESDKTAQEIAGILGVAHVLEGSVRKAGDKLRITAQLIRAADGFHLWSNTYDGELKDIFEVQEEIATAVADELKLTLGVGESFKQLGGTDNEKAYELYLVAKALYREGPNTVGKALEPIEKAVALDPDFALAWALKSNIHQGIGGDNTPDFIAGLKNGLDAALKAIELEPDLAFGYSSLGVIKTETGQWVDAETAYRKARELLTEPSLRYEVEYPMHYSFVGHIEKAKEILEGLLRNDPLNWNFRGLYIGILGLMGNIQQAEEEYEHGLALHGDQWSNNMMVDFYMRQTRLSSGDAVYHHEIINHPGFPSLKDHAESSDDLLEELHRIYADDGILGFNPWIAAYFGDPELAMDVVENIKNSGTFLECQQLWAPVMHEVRQLPRFKEFVREIGLVDYWEQFGWPDLCHPTDDGDFECD